MTGFKAFITGQLVAKCRAYRATLSYGEPIVWGLDVARDGLDKSALAVREGRKVHEVFGFREPNTMMLCEKTRPDSRTTRSGPTRSSWTAWAWAREWSTDYASFWGLSSSWTFKPQGRRLIPTSIQTSGRNVGPNA